VILATVLTVATHVPFILFLMAWFVVGRLVGGQVTRSYAYPN